MIVVAILGILAAIVLPEVQGYTQKAKESAAKDSLRTLRETIERYAADHNGVPPGYAVNNTSSTPASGFVFAQLIYKATDASGNLADIGTAGYPFGPYLSEMPQNPFNGKTSFIVVSNSGAFPAEGTGGFGWIYKPATKEIRLDYPGTDSSGETYFTY